MFGNEKRCKGCVKKLFWIVKKEIKFRRKITEKGSESDGCSCRKFVGRA